MSCLRLPLQFQFQFHVSRGRHDMSCLRPQRLKSSITISKIQILELEIYSQNQDEDDGMRSTICKLNEQVIYHIRWSKNAIGNKKNMVQCILFGFI